MTFPLAIQILLSFVLSFSFFFFESSTFFHRFAILLVTSFLPFLDGVDGEELIIASGFWFSFDCCFVPGLLLFVAMEKAAFFQRVHGLASLFLVSDPY